MNDNQPAGDLLPPPIKRTEAASGALDVGIMLPAIERYRGQLRAATDLFLISQRDVPTMFVALLSCLGVEAADVLFDLRHVEGAQTVFDEALRARFEKRAREG